MRTAIFFIALLFQFTITSGQRSGSQWTQAFPITDYIMDLNDSIKLVQVHLPEGYTIKEKQVGVLYGVYNSSNADVVEKGMGRCNLIKGNYYYFTIGQNTSGLPLRQGDLLYVMMDTTAIWHGQIPKIAAHAIILKNVYEEPFYERYDVHTRWTEAREKNLIDSIVADIRYTGRYFSDKQPSMDQLIATGGYKDKKLLSVMTSCQIADVRSFLGYMLARPRIYAGGQWKVSEIFATWLSSGAPVAAGN